MFIEVKSEITLFSKDVNSAQRERGDAANHVKGKGGQSTWIQGLRLEKNDEPLALRLQEEFTCRGAHPKGNSAQKRVRTPCGVENENKRHRRTLEKERQDKETQPHLNEESREGRKEMSTGPRRCVDQSARIVPFRRGD